MYKFLRLSFSHCVHLINAIFSQSGYVIINGAEERLLKTRRNWNSLLQIEIPDASLRVKLGLAKNYPPLRLHYFYRHFFLLHRSAECNFSPPPQPRDFRRKSTLAVCQDQRDEVCVSKVSGLSVAIYYFFPLWGTHASRAGIRGITNGNVSKFWELGDNDP